MTTMDIRKMLRAADGHVRSGNHARAIEVYDRVAEHYASTGQQVHAIAISKLVIAMIDDAAPILAPLYRHVWQRLADCYESMHMGGEAAEARDRWATLEVDEARVRPRARDRSN